MLITADALRDAMKLIYECSDSTVTCYDVDDLDAPEEDLNEWFGSIVQAGDTIMLKFPGEDDLVEWPIDKFVSDAPECASLTVGTQVTLRTPRYAFQLVSAASDLAQAVAFHNAGLPVDTPDGAKLRLAYSSLPVAVYASRIGAYEKHVVGAATWYINVEADFSGCSSRRDERLEADLIDAYLFELASSHNIGVHGRISGCFSLAFYPGIG